MPVETKRVQGRRELHFQSMDEVVADAERLVASPHTKMLGNWPLGQILTHLSLSINSSIDGISAKAPLLFRMLGPFIKWQIFKHGMSAGFQLPKQVEASFFPVATPQEGLEKLKAAVARLRTERMTSRHPVMGKMTHDEWLKLHLRHAELHLSFAVPD